MKTIIKGGWVIDPASGIDEKRDVLIEGGRILEAAAPSSLALSDAEVIDAEDCYVFPGLIDLHVHLREPGFEQKETIKSGCMAAVSGGFTSICCMANTLPVNDNTSVTGFILAKARSAGTARVFPVAAVTVGQGGESLSEMGELKEAGAVAYSDDGKCVMNAFVARNAMIYARSFDMPIAMHAIDMTIAGKGVMHSGFHAMKLGLSGIPAAAEDVMVARDAVLCLRTGARVHIQHISTLGAVEIIRDYKAKGAPITAEAAPHHFTLIDENVGDYDTNFKMMPPLREAADRDALIEGLADGTIDAIATDHAPHELLVKDCEFDNASNGAIGLETALALAWELVRAKKLSRLRAVELLTSGPARVFNLPFGKLAPGAPADISIFDPRPEYVFDVDRIFSLSKNSPFIGTKMRGHVVRTLVGGRTVFERE